MAREWFKGPIFFGFPIPVYTAIRRQHISALYHPKLPLAKRCKKGLLPLVWDFSWPKCQISLDVALFTYLLYASHSNPIVANNYCLHLERTRARVAQTCRAKEDDRLLLETLLIFRTQNVSTLILWPSFRLLSERMHILLNKSNINQHWNLLLSSLKHVYSARLFRKSSASDGLGKWSKKAILAQILGGSGRRKC